VLLSGGETTVTIRAEGPAAAGATPNACSAAPWLWRRAGIWALMGDTDGIDGSEANAGAIAGPTRWPAPAPPGSTPARLAAHDSHRVFAALGDLVETGPTLTNVNDFRAILAA
jgi:glycerate 2-kinase